jgi:hypothetical protein
MRILGSLALAACILAIAAPACDAEENALILRYQAFDSGGKALRVSTLALCSESGESIFVYRKDGGYEQRIVLSGDARLLQARYIGPGIGKAFSVTFSPREGRVLARTESRGINGWKPSLRDGDESLFFLLPRLLDLRAGASRTQMTIIRAGDRLSATFVFECLGLKKICVGGELIEVYDVRMVPGDLLLQILWPYANHYFFRATDMVMVRFEGPDAERRMGRIDLQSAEESRRSGG